MTTVEIFKKQLDIIQFEIKAKVEENDHLQQMIRENMKQINDLKQAQRSLEKLLPKEEPSEPVVILEQQPDESASEERDEDTATVY